MIVHSVLVADDMLEDSQPALEEAVEIAKQLRAKLTIVTVISVVSPGFGIPVPLGDAFEAILDEAEKRLSAQRDRILALGVPEVETKLLEGDPVDQVVEFVKERRPDLVVVGSRPLSSAGRFFLGSVSDGILHHVQCSVLVVKAPHPAPPAPVKS